MSLNQELEELQKRYITSLVSLYTDEAELAEQIKSVKDEAKDKGLDPGIISAVAKALVKDKVTELQEKSESILSAIKISRS